MDKRRAVVDALTYGFSISVILALVYLTGEEGLDLLTSPNWADLAMSFFMTVLFLEALALRYQVAMRWLYPDEKLSHLSALYGTSFGMTAGLILSKGVGQLLGKPAILKAKDGLSLRKGLYASSLEKVVDLTQSVLLVLPFLLVSQSKDGMSRKEALELLMFISMASIPIQALFLPKVNGAMRVFASWILPSVERLPLKGKSKVRIKLQEFAMDLQNAANNRTLAFGLVVLSLVKVFLMAGRIFFLSQAFSFPIPWELILLGIPVVQLGLVLGFTPGGIGVLEASWFLVFSGEGIPVEIVASFLLSFRLTNFLFFPTITLLVATFRKALPASDSREMGGGNFKGWGQ
jgi:uncharacterized protein (TIRG00374 family)